MDCSSLSASSYLNRTAQPGERRHFLSGKQRAKRRAEGVLLPREIRGVCRVIVIQVHQILGQLPRAVKISSVDEAPITWGKLRDVRCTEIHRYRTGDEWIEEFLGDVVIRAGILE